MKILKLLFCIVSLFSLTVSQILQENTEHKEVNLVAIALGFKGLLSGFQKGIYNDEFFQLDSKCLATYESNEKMMFIYNFINSKESPGKVISFVKSITQLINTELEYCGYTTTLLAMQEFCHHHSTVYDEKNDKLYCSQK